MRKLSVFFVSSLLALTAACSNEPMTSSQVKDTASPDVSQPAGPASLVVDDQTEIVPVQSAKSALAAVQVATDQLNIVFDNMVKEHSAALASKTGEEKKELQANILAFESQLAQARENMAQAQMDFYTKMKPFYERFVSFAFFIPISGLHLSLVPIKYKTLKLGVGIKGELGLMVVQTFNKLTLEQEWRTAIISLAGMGLTGTTQKANTMSMHWALPFMGWTGIFASKEQSDPDVPKLLSDLTGQYGSASADGDVFMIGAWHVRGAIKISDPDLKIGGLSFGIGNKAESISINLQNLNIELIKEIDDFGRSFAQTLGFVD